MAPDAGAPRVLIVEDEAALADRLRDDGEAGRVVRGLGGGPGCQRRMLQSRRVEAIGAVADLLDQIGRHRRRIAETDQARVFQLLRPDQIEIRRRRIGADRERRIVLAQQRGYYAQEGLKVTFQVGKGGVDKLDPAEMQRCVAIMAVLSYIAADLPTKIGR